jgi:TRAP-type C4-dicarboxylate transport system permease small subunit
VSAPVGPTAGEAARPRRLLAAADAGLAAFERALIVALLAVMAGAVFLDALHRQFAAEEGRLERLLVALAPAGLAAIMRRFVAPGLLALATATIAYFACKARSHPGAGRLRLLAQAALLTAALAGAARALVWLLPSGLIWSQQMALCFMLWVALAGASLGAREHAHIAFELAGKLWPRPLRRPVELLARLIAAAFTLLLAVLAVAHAREHYLEWSTSDGVAGSFEAFRVPRFLVFGFLPLPLATLALRFLAHGVRPAETP